MADDTDCDVGSNGEVFDDVESDPASILQNVEQACNKILIPSMAQSSMSKLVSQDQDSEGNDAIFVIKNDDSSDQNNDEENTTTDGEKARRLSSVNSPARGVRWTLETMASAMDSVLGGELTTTNAARKFGIPRTTLLDRLSMKVKRQHLETAGTFPLSAESDAKIVEFVRENSNLDKPTLLKGILTRAEELAKEQGRPFDNPLNTRKWLKLFVNKHPELDILQVTKNRSMSQSQRSLSVSLNHYAVRTSSVANTPSDVISHMIHMQQPSLLNSQSDSSPTNEIDICNDDESSRTEHDMDSSQVYDSFEATLAKQGVEAVERKLTAEQCSYFNYRFYNEALERGYELWKLCKSKADACDNENFESILSNQALVGIEQALVAEHLKYFRFRYENPDLEDGFKLWQVLKMKSTQQQ